MRTEIALRRVAFGCAIFLLFGPLGGRTIWENGTTTMTDSASYNMAAVFSGLLAIAGLVLADRVRPALVAPGAVIAIAAFGLTAYVAGLFTIPLLRGEVMVDGGYVMSVTEDVHPAYGPPFFAVAAIIGAVSTLAFAAGKLRQVRGA